MISYIKLKKDASARISAGSMTDLCLEKSHVKKALISSSGLFLESLSFRDFVDDLCDLFWHAQERTVTC